MFALIERINLTLYKKLGKMQGGKAIPNLLFTSSKMEVIIVLEYVFL